MLLAAVSSPGGMTLLVDVVIVLGVAVVLGMLLQRWGISPIVGYLLTGVMLGPAALGVVADVDTFSVMGELGIALLLFTIGLELPWHKLHRIGMIGVRAGVLQLVLTIAIATPLIKLAGVDWPAAIALSMAISLSSTAVVLRLLTDRSEIESVHGLAALGVLIAQDIATVLFLLVIGEMAGGSTQVGQIAADFAVSLAKLAALVGVMYLGERLVIRRLFRRMPGSSQRELLALVSITLSLSAVAAAGALELPIAIGGFAAGLVIGEAPYADQVRGEIAPLRTGLLVLFFAWVGMLSDLGYVVEHIVPIVALVAAIIVGKTLLVSGSLAIAGSSQRASVMAGLALAQVGEFSFAIAGAAARGDVIDENLFQLFVSASLVTLLLTPVLFAISGRVFVVRAGTAEGRGHLPQRAHDSTNGQMAGDEEGHAVVVGCGPAGKRVVDAMVDAGTPVVIVELNTRLLDAPKDRVRLVYGDATLAEILEKARVPHAAVVVITTPEPATVRRVVQNVRSHAPQARIVARARYHLYLDQIRDAGADEVIDEESETGEQLAGAALRATGSLP